MSLQFEEFKSQSHLPEQRELFVKCFPENAGGSAEKKEHYDWKFHGFPAPPHRPRSYEYAARLDGAIVGYYAAIPYPYVVNGKVHKVGMVCDVMTDPSQQGKGIFTKLGAYSTDSLRTQGVSFTTGYPIRPWVIPGHLKVGWKIAFKLPIYIRVLKFTSALKAKKLGAVAPILNLLLRAQRAAQRAFVGFDPAYITRVLSQRAFAEDRGYDGFFSLWSAEQENYLVKSKEFLAWRTSAPGTQYHFLQVTKAGSQVAFALARKVELEKIPCLAILDLMVLKDHVSCLASLQECIAELAERQGAELVVSMMSPTTAKRLKVGRSGFLRSPKVFSLIIKRLSPELGDDTLFEEKSWNLFWIDSDDL